MHRSASQDAEIDGPPLLTRRRLQKANRKKLPPLIDIAEQHIMASSAKQVIAVDIDEVLCDFVSALVRFHNDMFGTKLKQGDFFSYKFSDVWGGTDAESQDKMSLFFASSYFLIEMKAIAKAQEVTRSLKDSYDLHLVTSRQHKLEEITRIWVRKNFPDTFTAIHFGNHYCEEGQKSIPKSELCRSINAVLLIDDNLDYAIDCSNHSIPVILFGDYAWNRGKVPDVNAPLVYRVADWERVPQAIGRALELSRRRATPARNRIVALQRKPVVAVDIDEVLASFSASLIQFYNESYGRNLGVDDIHTLRFSEVFNCSTEESNSIIELFCKSSHFRDGLLPVDEQAFHHLGVLREKYELHVVTARKRQVEDVTRAWIDTHFPNIFTEIHFGNHYLTDEEVADLSARGLHGHYQRRHKSEICKSIGANLLIDDHVDYAIECAKEGIHVILFGDYSWNRNLITDDAVGRFITRASNWNAVSTAIDAILMPLSGTLHPAVTFYKPVLAVDIDEVLASFLSSMVQHYNETNNTSYSTKDIVENKNCPILSGTEEQKTAQVDDFMASSHFRDGLLPVDEQAFHHLGVLREKYELHVVTARKRQVEDVTRAWIDTHFPNIFTEIHFGNHYLTDEEVADLSARGLHGHYQRRHKSEICKSIGANLLIDDNIDYAIECAKEGIHVILFGDYSWNKGLLTPDLKPFITRVSSWADVSNTVNRIMASDRIRYHHGRATGIIAAVQMCSSNDKLKNREFCGKMVVEAARNGAQLVCFPECCTFMGRNAVETLGAAEDFSSSTYRQPLTAVEIIRQEDPEKKSSINFFRELAVRNDIWLSLGGLQELRSDLDFNKISNAHVVIAPDGAVKAVYRKIHLFDAPAVNLMESENTAAGVEPVVVDMGFAKVGISICYDLRFPELYAHLRSKMGAEVLLIPAAFTVPTGSAHWEVLLRSRAIENQCVVVAAAQHGVHNEKRTSYGHTMIVDAWGRIASELPAYTPGGKGGDSVSGSLSGMILAQEDDGNWANNICYFKYDPSVLKKIRSGMPVQDHHKYHLFRG